MNTKELGDLFENYDLVLIVNDDEALELAKNMADHKMMAVTKKKLLFLTSISFDIPDDFARVCTISETEMEDIMDIYRTYEASDKIVMLSETSLYGGLQNYVRSGLLGCEEMIRAIIM